MVSYRGFNSNEVVIYLIMYFYIFCIFIRHLDFLTCEMPVCDLGLFSTELFISYWFLCIWKYFWHVSFSLLLGCMCCENFSQFATVFVFFFFHSICGVFWWEKVVNFSLAKFIKLFLYIVWVLRNLFSPQVINVFSFFFSF